MGFVARLIIRLHCKVYRKGLARFLLQTSPSSQGTAARTHDKAVAKSLRKLRRKVSQGPFRKKHLGQNLQLATGATEARVLKDVVSVNR